MEKKVRLAIIGAGTAGLSAYKEAKKYTDDILLIDGGPLGSTCARVGCMPSKLLIQAANDYHHKRHFKEQGIYGSEHLFVSVPDVLQYVREMRDSFTASVVELTKSLDKQFLYGHAQFTDLNTLTVGDQTINADAIIIASGSTSIIAENWLEFQNDLLTSETIFEAPDLQQELGLVGVGSIGLEFGQALARLGMSITAFNAGEFIGGLSDPKVNETALTIFRKEFPILLNEKVSLKKEHGKLFIQCSHDVSVNQVIVAMGREPGQVQKVL